MISASEATTALTSALKAFNLAADDAIKVVDKLTKVDQLAAVSAGGIATALQKSATSAKLAGMSMDELIGSVSVIGEVTQQSMDTVGNAMKSILARYGNVKAGVFTSMGLNDDGETTENINDIEKVLSKLGIKIRTSATDMRSMTDVLDELSGKWITLDEVSKNAVATAFGGTRMRENFLVLMENWTRVKELTEESANSAGTADEKYEAVTDSIEASMKRVQNAWENMSRKFEASWLVKSGLGILEGFVSNLDKIVRLLTVAMATKFSGKILDFGLNTFKGIPNVLKKLTGFGANSQGSVTYDENGKMIVTPQETQRDFLIRKSTQTIVNSLDKNGVDIIGQLKIIQVAIEKQNLLGAKPQYDQDGRMISGLGINGRSVKRVQENGQWVYKYADTNRKVQSDKYIQRLNRQQSVIDQYNSQLGISAQTGQISGYEGQSYWGEAKQVTIDGQKYRRDKSGQYFLNNTMEVMDPEKQKQVDVLNTQLKSARKGAMVKQGIVAGVSTAIGELSTTKQVGAGQGGFLSNLAIKGIVGDSDITVEEDTADKIIRTGVSSGLAAVGGAYLGPFGAMLGQTVGEGISSIISVVRHKNELEMKQRVEEANKNLSALKSIRETIEKGDEMVRSAIINSDNREKYNEYVDSIRDFFIENADFTEAFLAELKEQGAGNYNTINDVLTKAYGAFDNAEFRGNLQNALNIITAELMTSNKIASQEEERAKFYEKYGGYFGNDGNYAQKLEALQEQIRRGEIDRKELLVFKEFTGSDMIELLSKAALEEEKLDKEVWATRATEAYAKSKISTKSTSDLEKLGLKGAITQIAEQMNDSGLDVFDKSGKIYSRVYNAILSEIMSDEDVYKKLERGSYTIGEYFKDVKTYSERIDQFARSFNITEEEAERLSGTFSELTIAMGNMTPDEVIEYYKELADVFSEVTSSGKLTAESLNNIIQNIPRLVPYALQGVDSLKQAIYEALAGGEMDYVYENSLYNTLMSSSTIFDQFVKENKDKLSDKAKEAGSLLSLQDLVNEGKLSEEDKSVFEEWMSKQNVEYQADLTAQNILREATISQMEKELTNLEDQKSALSDINEQRKKELEYIKAKNALEDARKEKKRVFRSGVGWTYETDESAVSEAREKLDDLEIEKNQEAIQYQIDAITAQKEFLEALPDAEQKESMEKLWELLGGDGEGSITSKVQALSEAYTGAIKKFNLGDKARAANAANEGREPNDTLESDKVQGKLKKNRLEIGVKDIGRGFTDWGNDDITLVIDSKRYHAETTDHSDLMDDQNDITKAYSDTPIRGDVFKYGRGYYVYNGAKWERILTDEDDNDFWNQKDLNGKGWLTLGEALKNISEENAQGSQNFAGGKTLINELGTEAIITPSGTVTALPAKTGIVPADITKNLWSLGEVAPTLVAQLGSLTQKPISSNSAAATYEEGQYFDHFIMNVYPEKGDDFSKILEQARTVTRLSKRNN